MIRGLLGVDGGNTKTDYLLFSAEGARIAALRVGTRSHEALSGGFDEAFSGIRADVLPLLRANGLAPEEVSAAMGLAGDDLPYQHEALWARLSRLGFARLALGNDALLGIKAVSETGAGVCCICGTGTVAVGVDDRGRTLQIGGVGSLCGDDAGGGYVARVCVARAYGQIFRSMPRTALADEVLQIMGFSDETELLPAVHDRGILLPHQDALNRAAQRLAVEGDPACRKILDDMGAFLGGTTAGVLNRLTFDAPPTVALAGSVIVKAVYPGIRAAFDAALARAYPKPVRVALLREPPAAGAVVWAREGLGDAFDRAAFQRRVLAEMKA